MEIVISSKGNIILENVNNTFWLWKHITHDEKNVYNISKNAGIKSAEITKFIKDSFNNYNVHKELIINIKNKKCTLDFCGSKFGTENIKVNIKIKEIRKCFSS